jgi:hypothetical protein
MDLRSLKERLDAAPLEASRLVQEGAVLRNIAKFKQLVEFVGDLPPIEPLAYRIRTSTLYQIGADAFSLDASSASQLKALADELYLTVTGLQQALASVVPPIPPETVIAAIPGQSDLASI